VKYHDVSLHLF